MDDESQAVIILTADQAERHGVQWATTMPGYSGAGYVTGFDADGDAMTWTLTRLPKLGGMTSISAWQRGMGPSATD